MSDEVSENIELHLLDTRVLVEEARKIRKARDLAKQATQAKKELAAGISPLGTPTLAANLPKGFFIGGPQTRAGAITGARTDNQFRNLQQKQKDLEDYVKKLEKERQAFESKLLGAYSIGSQIITNPASIPGMLLSRLGRYGIVGSLVALSGGFVLEEIGNQFERGGIFSIRLKVPKQALTLNDIEEQNAFRSGTKYLTSDMRVIQRAPESSNTGRISWEAIRYTLDTLGK